MLLLLTLSLAHAESIYDSVADACDAADLAVVVRATQVQAYVPTSQSPPIRSVVTFQTIGVAKGSAPNSFSLDVEGGRMNGIQLIVSDRPTWIPNNLYFLVLYEDASNNLRIVSGAGAVRLDPAATIPPDSALAAAWQDKCYE